MPIAHLKRLLRPARRRLNQWLGRDLPYRTQIQCRCIRLGSEYGGWVIRPDWLERGSIVYSVGVGQDISFDLELIRRFGVVVHAFDPTPRSVEWVRAQSLPPQFVFHEIGLAEYDGSARFVLPRADYVSYHVGAADEGGIAAHAIDAPVQRLSSIMRILGHQRVDLLKMDIEGAEYAVIADLIAAAVPIRQLLVEFHHSVGDAPSLQRTRQAIESLLGAGYHIFDVSPIGLEYSFCMAADRVE